MNRKIRAAGCTAVLALSLLASVPSVADFVIDWWTIDGGGEVWLAEPKGEFELSGTVGQPDASPVVMTGGGYDLSGGFWPGASGFRPPVPGDCDGDQRVDLDDYQIFAACMAGPGLGVGAECSCADLDGDGDSDLADIAQYQRVFTGP